MSVTAPPRPPTPAVADALEALREEALIKEARARARRRRRRYAAALAVATAIVGLGAVFALHPDKGGAQPSAAARPLAPTAASATRSTIVFATNPSGKALLYRMNSDGSGLHRLFSWKTLWQRVGHWGTWPALSPDGRHIAFQAGTPRRPGIEIANLDGTGVHWVNGGEHPTWSPDGTYIAYSTWSEEIDVEHPDGTGWRLVTLHGRFPSWSPDGTKLAYVCRPRHASLCVMNVDGTGQHQIAAEPATRPRPGLPTAARSPSSAASSSSSLMPSPTVGSFRMSMSSTPTEPTCDNCRRASRTRAQTAVLRGRPTASKSPSLPTRSAGSAASTS